MAQKSSHAARKKGGVWKILLVLVVLLALAVGGALLFARNEISGNGRPGTEVTVSIPQGRAAPAQCGGCAPVPVPVRTPAAPVPGRTGA